MLTIFQYQDHQDIEKMFDDNKLCPLKVSQNNGINVMLMMKKLNFIMSAKIELKPPGKENV